MPKYDDLIYPPNLREPGKEPQTEPIRQLTQTVPGSVTVKAASVLMTIFGGLASLLAFGSLILNGEIVSLLRRFFLGSFFVAIFEVLSYGGIALTLAYGIKGIRYAGNPARWWDYTSKGTALLLIYPISAAFLLITNIYSLVHSPVILVFVIFIAAAACAPPILYIMGGNRLKSAHFQRSL